MTINAFVTGKKSHRHAILHVSFGNSFGLASAWPPPQILSGAPVNLEFHKSSDDFIEKGGKLGRKVGSLKTAEQMKAEYREVISLLRKGYSIRDVAKLCGKGVSTVQRVKRLLKVQSSL